MPRLSYFFISLQCSALCKSFLTALMCYKKREWKNAGPSENERMKNGMKKLTEQNRI